MIIFMKIIELESSACVGGLFIGVQQTVDTVTAKKQLCEGYCWAAVQTKNYYLHTQ